MNKVAFFDFDNTIYDGYTYEDVINYISQNILRDDKFQVQVKHVLKTSSNYNEIVVGIANVVSEMIIGWNYEKFLECCEYACKREKILDWVVPVTRFLKMQGFRNILVTASFEEMLVDSLKIINIDETFCSIFEKSDDKYTGKIKLLLNDEKKVDAIQNIISEENTFSIAFGDSMGDAPMLGSVDMAFLVRSNDNEIENLAKEKGWYLGLNPDLMIELIEKKLEIKKNK